MVRVLAPRSLPPVVLVVVVLVVVAVVFLPGALSLLAVLCRPIVLCVEPVVPGCISILLGVLPRSGRCE